MHREVWLGKNLRQNHPGQNFLQKFWSGELTQTADVLAINHSDKERNQEEQMKLKKGVLGEGAQWQNTSDQEGCLDVWRWY